VSLAALFSLISAAILGLLPVLLLFGRRRMQRSNRPTGEANRPTGEATQPSDAALRATGREDAQSGERPILDRLARDRRSESNQRELREAAIIAGVWPATASPASASSATASPAAAHDERKSAPPPHRRRSLEQRLARLTPLQRAIAYSEILGPPAALRSPGRGDHRA
jgi:hypothetical protein